MSATPPGKEADHLQSLSHCGIVQDCSVASSLYKLFILKVKRCNFGRHGHHFQNTKQERILNSIFSQMIH